MLSRLEALLGDLALAGRRALALQADGPLTLPAKEELPDPMGQALTIADPVIQAFLEGRFALREPGWRIEVEEAPYRFLDDPPEVTETLWLDPIDGTRYYADGRARFGISLALTRGDRVIGGIYAVPTRGVAFIGAAGEGAWTLSLTEPRTRSPLTFADPPAVLWTRIPEGPRAALEGDGFEVVDPSWAYDPAASLAAWHVLDGGLAGLVMPRGAHVRDGGAIAFLAQEAGATVLTPAGEPWVPRIQETGRVSPAIVSGSPERAARLRELLVR